MINMKPPPHKLQAVALCISDVRMFVCSFVRLSPKTHLELWSLLTTNKKKSYVGFSQNPFFLDPQDDLERQQISPCAQLMTLGAYRVDPPDNTLVITSPGLQSVRYCLSLAVFMTLFVTMFVYNNV